jgi:DNA polymerase-1
MAKATSKKRLILLDAHAIIHRAYHALPEFATKDGEPTGALYGIAAMLMKAIADLKPDYIVAAYDLPGGTFRHDTYANYKAGRKEADEALIKQFKTSRDLLAAFAVPIYDRPGFEADDILGTIAEMTRKEKNLEVVIVTGDMDTLQLVEGDRVKVFTLRKGLNDTVLYDEKTVLERYLFHPLSLPDYKGLRGDPSDNIIGVSGIGEKTATTLISHYKTIEAMYKDLEKDATAYKRVGITERIQKLLIENKDEAFFSKELATIRRDAPIDFTLPAKTYREGVDVEDIKAFLVRMEFRSLVPRVEKLFNGESTTVVAKNDKVKKVVPEKEPEEEVKISDDEFEKLALALWLLDSNKTDIQKNDVVHFGKAKNLDEAKKKILEAIEKNGLSYVYNNMELPLIPLVHEMSTYGVKLDTQYLEKLSTEYHAMESALEKEIWKYAGHEFNIASPKQLGDVLYDELALEPEGKAKLKKTAGGARSTRESELDKLLGVHPIIESILKYREVSKLLSTYIDVMPKLVGDDGRLHATFNPRGAVTGRFSSENPNLQNLPIKSELGKNIRHAFIAEAGYELVSFDYSQIELRIAALLSQDPTFLEIFNSGKDVHAAVASRVFGVEEKDVTPEMRRRAKVINFGILYGMGVTALKQNLGTDRKEAQAFYDAYFLQFPRLANYLEETREFARKHGYTVTLFGRKRIFKDMHSPLPFIKAMAERMAINAPIQGTATADIIKLAIIDVDQALVKKGLKDDAHLIMQVHDELVFEVKKEKVEDFILIAQEKMCSVIPEEFLEGKVSVPLLVGIGRGRDYGALK